MTGHFQSDGSVSGLMAPGKPQQREDGKLLPQLTEAVAAGKMSRNQQKGREGVAGCCEGCS